MPTREAIEDQVPLADAVAMYRAACGHASSLQTYRKHAAEGGRVHLGVSIPAAKDRRGRWVVPRPALDRGIATELERLAGIRQATVDYRNHVLRGPENVRVDTDWGFYEVRGAFHFHFDRTDAYRKRNNGTWVCNFCWTSTQDEHGREECHTCSDWGDCGQNCTLSAIRCDECGTRLEV